MSLDRTRPTVSVCRGCCCGTAKKHPSIDHEAQLVELRELVRGIADLRVTDCLGPCERSNVLVVSPSSGGRRRGGRAIWFGQVLDEKTGSAIAGWLRDGGPGVADFPRSLWGHRFERPKAPR